MSEEQLRKRIEALKMKAKARRYGARIMRENRQIAKRRRIAERAEAKVKLNRSKRFSSLVSKIMKGRPRGIKAPK